MSRRILGGLCAIGCTLLAPISVFPQSMKLEPPPSERQREQSTRPGQPRQLERDLYPHRPPVPHAPGFLAPLSKETETGRAGIAGWTAPSTRGGSRGAGDPDNAGWFGFGFAVESGGRPVKPTRTN